MTPAVGVASVLRDNSLPSRSTNDAPRIAVFYPTASTGCAPAADEFIIIS